MGALLALTTAVALVMGVWAAAVRPYAEQARAVAALREFGFEIELGPAAPSWWRRACVAAFVGSDAYAEAVSLRWAPDPAKGRASVLPDDFASMLSSMRRLRTIDVDRTDFDDEDAAGLAGLTELEELSLRFTQVTDAGVGRLTRAGRLKTIRLTGCRVSDAGLASLAQLPSLTEVYARWTDISNSGKSTYGDLQGVLVHWAPR